MKEGDGMKKGETVLMERKLILEIIDDEGNYVKSSAREIEQLGFYIRIMHINFVPCECCQRAIVKEIHKSKSWNIGNKDTEPPVELWRKFEIDDNSWKEENKRKATKEDITLFGPKGKYPHGLTTYV
jgi:hypothetical protein